MDILFFEDGTVPRTYAAQISDLLAQCYEPDAPTFDFPHEPRKTFVAIDPEDGVIGHLETYVRHVVFPKGTLAIGLIGNVASHPKFRRRGIVKQMLAITHQDLRAQAIPFSVLFAYVTAIYVSSGYQPMQNEIYFQDEDGQWKTFVYRGGMYCELSHIKWPNGLIDLNGRAV